MSMSEHISRPNLRSATGLADPNVFLKVVGVAFCLSGIPAIVYQIAWQRILALHSGVGAVSVAIIVAAYMAGLGLGSLLGGAISGRLSSTASLFAFAGLELTIGGFGFASCKVYHEGLSGSPFGSYSDVWATAASHLLALAGPTILMGMTLPLLTRATVSDVSRASSDVSVLYGLNGLGAAIGALITPWLLIRNLGIEQTVRVAACCNVAVGLSVLAIGLLRSRASAVPVEARSPATPAVAPKRRPFALWLAVYTLGGFFAIALEILWFRLIDVAVKSTSYTFGTVLGVYLLGLTGGCLVGSKRSSRMRDPFLDFLACQCLLILASGLVIALIVLAPANLWGLEGFYLYWASYEPYSPSTQSAWEILRLYAGLPLIVFAFPTFLMGYSFAALQRGTQDRAELSGARVGVLQAGNIAGCMAGSLLTGLYLLDAVGSAGTLRMLVGMGALLALFGMTLPGRRTRFLALGMGLVACYAILPDRNGLWRRFHGQSIESKAIYEEDLTGVSSMIPESGRVRMSTNGKGQSYLPYGQIHSKLGALPSLIHPNPRRVALIGLGTGDTPWAAACRRETETVTVFELCSNQPRLLERSLDFAPYPPLRGLLDDPRVSIVAADGRASLRNDEATYDVIEADAIRPNGAYAGHLYSVEFFQLSAKRLNPGGIHCNWSPTPRARATFRRVFPHVLEVDGGAILMGSMQPIPFEPEAWRRRLLEPSTAAYLGREVVDECLRGLSGAKLLPPPDDSGRPPLNLNSDLWPYDEFETPSR